MRVYLKGERGVIEDAPLAIVKRFKELARSVAKGRLLTFHHCHRNWQLIHEWLPDVTLPPEVESMLSAPQIKHSDILGTEDGYVFGSDPYQHQRIGFSATRDLRACGLFMDPGTGKSKIVVDTACYNFARGNINMCAVVAPNGVQHKWVLKEVPTHAPSWCKVKAYSCQSSSLADGIEKALRSLMVGQLTFLTINAEAISSEKIASELENLVKTQKVLLVIDESTRFKSITKSKRGAQMLDIVRQATMVRILTGSIFVRDAEDVYGQLKMLTENPCGERTITGFRARFCEVEPKFGQVVGSRNIEELHDEVKRLGFVALKHDCLDLPAKVYVDRICPLTPEQKRHYTNIKDLLCTELEGYTEDGDGNIRHKQTGKLLEVPNVVAKMTRLQQIVCGHLVDPDTKEVFELDCTPRLMALHDIFNEMPRKAIVWTRYATEAHRIHGWLQKKGWHAVPYTGRVDPKERQRNLDAFQADGGPRILVGTMAAGGIGLDMTAADEVIYYSNDFNAELRWQSEDRAHRIGQTQRVRYTDLIAPGTVDRYIIKNVKAKEDFAKRVKGLSSWLEIAKGEGHA